MRKVTNLDDVRPSGERIRAQQKRQWPEAPERSAGDRAALTFMFATTFNDVSLVLIAATHVVESARNEAEDRQVDGDDLGDALTRLRALPDRDRD